MPRHQGYIPFGSNDDDIIVSAALTSSTAIAGATVNGSPSFNANGMLLGATDYCRWQGINACNNGFHISMEVEKGFFNPAYLPTGNEVLINITGSGTAHIRHQISSGLIYLGNSGAVAPYYNSGILRDSQTHYRVDLSCTNWGIDLHVDHLLCMRHVWAAKPDISSPTTAYIYAGGAGTGGVPNPTFRMRNVQIIKRPLYLPWRPNFKLCVLSDSFAKTGQYPLTNHFYLGEQTESYGDSTIRASDTYTDEGFIPTMHRELHRNGVYTPRIHWHGRGGAHVNGAQTNDLTARVDSMLGQEGSTIYPAPGQRQTVTHVVICIGTNDISSGTSDANFDSSYKAEIDRLIAAGVRKIYVNTLMKRYDANHDTAIAAKNALIRALPQYNANVHVYELHQGSVDNPSYVSGDGIHPSLTGSAFIGRQAGRCVLANL